MRRKALFLVWNSETYDSVTGPFWSRSSADLRKMRQQSALDAGYRRNRQKWPFTTGRRSNVAIGTGVN
jgi:hypothetical protein